MRWLLALLLACSALRAERWKLQYFHDEDKSSLNITDLKFLSTQRGIAVGMLTRENSAKPVSLLTSDGGTTWSSLPIKEAPLSLFFLNDSLGWMVTEKGLWITEESGRSWRKLKVPAGVVRVYFRDPKRGWAVGLRKLFLETTDGGATWEKVALASEIKSRPEYTHFGWIDFATHEVGLVAGWNRSPRRFRQELPDWADPENALKRRQWPSIGVLLDTKDGGKSWTPSASSIFGRITHVRMSPEGWGVGLIEYEDAFEVPSEAVFLNLRSGANRTLFKSKDRKTTDVAIGGPRGPIYLGGIEHLSKLNQSPIPGKVRILRSRDAQKLEELEVDYRAVARRVILAGSGDQAWAATDTGMILKLVP